MKSFIVAVSFIFLLPKLAMAELLIEENFEKNGYEEFWSETIGANCILDEDSTDIESPVYGGIQLLKAVSADSGYKAYSKRTLSSEEPTTFFRAYINISEENLSIGSNKCLICALDFIGNFVWRVLINKNTEGLLKFQLQVYNNSNEYFTFPGDVVNNELFYLVEVKYDATNQECQFRVDEVTIETITLSRGYRSGIKELRIGALDPNNKNELTIYYDRIGLDTEHYPKYSLLKQVVLPSGDANVSQWTASSGTDLYPLISDDSDDTYIYTSQNYQMSKFHMENPIHDGMPVGIRVWIRMKNIDGNSQLISTGIFCSDGHRAKRMWATENLTNRYIDFPYNPVTGKEWTWEELDDLKTTLFSTVNENGGGLVSRAWVEVFSGDSDDYPMFTHGPVFGGVTDNQIKVWAKSDKECEFKIRYGINEDNVKSNNGVSMTSSLVADSSTDYCCIFTIDQLLPDTRYYFNVLIDEISVYDLESSYNPRWISLPACKTSPLYNNDLSFSFALIADRQSLSYPADGTNFYSSIADKNPAFLIHTGDWATIHTDDPNEIKSIYKKWAGDRHQLIVYELLDKMPLFRIWSDHDYCSDNANKIGNVYNEGMLTYNMLDITKYYFPFPVLGTGAVDGDLSGIATGGNARILVDSEASFLSDDIYPGMIVWKTVTGREAWAIIESVDSDTQITLSDVLSRGEIFSNTDKYRIKRGGLWYKFKWGNAEFFMVDTRYKRDPNGTINGDMLDGRQYGAGMLADSGGGLSNGHIQRDWLVQSVNNSTARWKFICNEMPFKHDEVQSQDKWGDFDPNDAQYTYLKQNITAINVIWLAGDRHFAALDDASQANDPWPVVLPGPAYPVPHEATGFYKVNGLDSVYDKTHELNFMSFAIIEVGRDSVTVSIYDTKGNLINNGTRYFYNENRQPLMQCGF